MLENIQGHSRGSIPPLRMPGLLPHDLCHEWNVSRRLPGVWYSHVLKNFPQFVVIHTIKGFGIVNKAKVDVPLELSCFLYDPTDVGNLISGSSAFFESSLNIWKFLVHVLLKPGLENFEHYFASM